MFDKSFDIKLNKMYIYSQASTEKIQSPCSLKEFYVDLGNKEKDFHSFVFFLTKQTKQTLLISMTE